MQQLLTQFHSPATSFHIFRTFFFCATTNVAALALLLSSVTLATTMSASVVARVSTSLAVCLPPQRRGPHQHHSLGLWSFCEICYGHHLVMALHRILLQGGWEQENLSSNWQRNPSGTETGSWYVLGIYHLKCDGLIFWLIFNYLSVLWF